MRRAAGFALGRSPCSLLFQLNYLNDSRLSITTMPTIFARGGRRKYMVGMELGDENKYCCERRGLTAWSDPPGVRQKSLFALLWVLGRWMEIPHLSEVCGAPPTSQRRDVGHPVCRPVLWAGASVGGRRVFRVGRVGLGIGR